MGQKEFEASIELPKGLSAKVEKNVLEVSHSGKKVAGNFSQMELEVSVDGNKIVCKAKKKKKSSLASLNAFMAKAKNLCMGLSAPYEYKLEIVYSHFPLTLTQKEKIIEVTNVGGSKKNRIAPIVGETTVQVKGKEIIVKGLNKEHVGQTAANLEQASKIRGKDSRVFQDGIYIVSKPVKRAM